MIRNYTVAGSDKPSHNSAAELQAPPLSFPAPGATAVEPELPDFEGASPELTMALENALESLSEADDRSARVAELRIFGALPLSTIAPIVGLTEIGAEKDWRFAKAFLAKHLRERGQIA